MFTIDKYNQIRMTRGDTATMLVSVFDLDEKPYEIKPTDTVTFTVRTDAESAIALQLTADEQHYITILPEHTAELEPDIYVYDVQLTTEDGYNYTIIPRTYFILTEEITY